MKFMKIGSKPDTFFTEEATRSVISDSPSDIVICIDNIKYLLHKIFLLPKCGLLRRLCLGSNSIITIELHDIPGGADAFELCAKFCYGIIINLGAHNFVPALCAAKFLQMTETVEKGNLVQKLQLFFDSCILQGWKDSVLTLQNTLNLSDWSENVGISRRCVDSIVEKILTPNGKVSWSYTYTRKGYNKNQHRTVPKDWWTEDLADLDIDLFRCIITAVSSTYVLPPQLIGEALHVYACRWLPDTTKPSVESSVSRDDGKNRHILETIVSMLPAEKGSVSVGFLLRLLSIANYVGASPVAKTELTRKASMQFEEATLDELLFSSSHHHGYDTDLVMAVLESYLLLWGRPDSNRMSGSIRKVGKLLDSYLQVVAQDANIPVAKLVTIAEALPDIARQDHNALYKAINIYLKEHPDVSKADRKRLCKSLDCQKLSAEVRAHAVRNERLPLRTVVQVLFFDLESSSNLISKIRLGSEQASETSGKEHKKIMRADKKVQVEMNDGHCHHKSRNG